MHIAVIGSGYVGLVTGACFAEFGVDVTCVDVDQEKIQRLAKGVMPIYEPGLEHLVAKNTAAGRLRFTTNVREAIEQALVIFLAVGTPPQPDGSPDLSFVEAAAASIADYMSPSLRISFDVQVLILLPQMFLVRGQSTALSRPLQRSLKPLFCRPVVRWVTAIRTSRRR